MFKVGIDTRIFKHLRLDDAVCRISSLFSIVEICATHIRRMERDCMTIGDIANIINRLRKDLNIEVAQVHAPYGDIDEMLTDPDKREEGIARLLRYVELCHKIECPVLVMHVPYRGPIDGERYIDYIASLESCTRLVMRKLERHIRDLSVKIALENRLEQTFGSRVEDIVKIICEEGVEGFGICLDTGHANVNKIDIAETVRKFGKYIIATHVHDNDGTQDRHMPPLMGCIDWKRVMDSFRSYCPQIPLILEVESLSERCSENVLRLCRVVISEIFR
ncbi:MAG: sugar phosphate isomerase/epimerase [Crenarchaeota archaeon]|nr:sugar phosphate isomerase/epimerase [Thermoproteota archaeon]